MSKAASQSWDPVVLVLLGLHRAGALAEIIKHGRFCRWILLSNIIGKVVHFFCNFLFFLRMLCGSLGGFSDVGGFRHQLEIIVFNLGPLFTA